MSDAKKMLKELAYTHLVPKDEQGRELVAVVRCKDCKHYQYYVFLDDGKFCCRMKTGSGNVAWYPRSDDDYCSYGERKDDE